MTEPTEDDLLRAANVYRCRSQGPSPKRCAAGITSKSGSGYYRQCSLKPVNHEAGHGWCKTHTPSLKIARDQEREAAWKRENFERARAGAIEDARADIVTAAIVYVISRATGGAENGFETLAKAVQKLQELEQR